MRKIRKLIATALSLVMVLTTLAGMSFSQAADTPYITIEGPSEVNVGEDFTFDVVLYNGEGTSSISRCFSIRTI